MMIDFNGRIVMLQRVALSRHNLRERDELLAVANLIRQLEGLKNELIESVGKEEDHDELENGKGDTLALRLIAILGLQVKVAPES